MPNRGRLVSWLGYCSNALIISVLLLVCYGVAWTYSTHRYLQGFSDAIVPLVGSPEEKSEALLEWFRHQPERSDDFLEGTTSLRNPVNIVRNTHLLKICGSAANAFINLADVAGLRTRRLLLVDDSGGAKHVVAEVQWSERWVVVDPQQGRVFRDHAGRPLTKEQLHDPNVFRDAISLIPGYDPSYGFERTAHLHLRRIPVVGNLMRQALDRFVPGWEEAIDWGYFPENPSLWPVLMSVPLLLLAVLLRLIVNRYSRNLFGHEVVIYRRGLVRESSIPDSLKSA